LPYFKAIISIPLLSSRAVSRFDWNTAFALLASSLAGFATGQGFLPSKAEFQILDCLGHPGGHN
jgi:hypothetical protein